MKNYSIGLIWILLITSTTCFGQTAIEEVVIAGKKIIIYDNNTWGEKPILKRHTLKTQVVINIYADGTWEEAEDVQVGERLPDGSIVGYLLKEGDPGYDPLVQHGLALCIDCLDASKITWECMGGSLVEANSYEDGTANTNIIAETCSNLHPAKQCRGLGEEWYLPSAIELGLINMNKNSISGLKEALYWTSTAVDASQQAMAADFSSNSGGTTGTLISEEHYFIPVKKF
jgi:hypothetical protein